MKKILFFATLLSSLAGFCQVITVNTTQTPTQLVNNVLVDNSCLVQISNIVTSTGSNFGSSNGIGSYQNTNTSFPVTSSGLLLTTGQASLSPGPNTSVLSNGGSSATWLGNAELQATLAAAGITMQSKNATLFQFDFVPNSSSFGFDFLFASEEYGAFQCTTNDAFIVLLDNLDDAAPAFNVALIPSTTDPITVANIRNVLYNSDCASLNANWFGQFNGGSNAAGSAINYNGQTKLMHAGGVLVPNANYRIKFIIADDAGTDGTDGDYDSAVFIPAGSLNLGHQVFDQDFTFANGNPLCYGLEYVLDTGLDPATYTFEWRRGNTVLAETGPALTIDEAGTYSVTLTHPVLGCVTTQSIVVQYTPEIPAQQANNIFKCENPTGTYQYDLSVNTPILKQGLNPNTVITYHADQDDANDDVDALPLSYNSPTGVTIWARVENPDNGCYTLRSFQLLTSPPPTATQPSGMVVCETTQGSNSAVFNLNLQDAVILGSQPIAENIITYYTSVEAATLGTPAIDTPASFTGSNQTIYARIQKAFDAQCFSITSFNLTVSPLPVLPAPSTLNACNSYTLPAIPGGSYFTGIGGTGTERPAGTVITTSQTLYAYAQSGGTPNCSNQSELVINIITASTAPQNVTACLSYILPNLNPGEQYRSAPGGGGTEILAGTEITATQTIYFFIPAAADCTQNNSFIVTITSTPAVVENPDITQCDPYVLPVLPNGQKYHTAPNGGGTQLANGATISTSQTIYIYTTNPSNPLCTAQSEFVVTINGIQLADQANITRCNQYVLPALAVGNYYSQPGGVGAVIPVGTVINSSQTVYIYVQSGACSDEDSFDITIYPLPSLENTPNVSVCNSYTLPQPPAGAHFYSGTGGVGLLPPGTVITATQTVYVRTEPNEFGCSRQRTFIVTVTSLATIDMNDVYGCNNYTLPVLANGNYYTGPNGSGTMLSAGTVITSTQLLYVYLSTTNPVCTVQDSFTITITTIPTLPQPPAVIACGSYTLPAIQGVVNGTAGYYTATQGGGTNLPVGTVINASQNIFVYATSGGAHPCTRQRILNITIIPNNTIAPANVVSCGPYTLPALPLGNYFTAPAGGGSQIPAGTIITTNQTIYPYVATTVGTNCTADDSFTVTINPMITADDPDDVVSCTPYELPALTNGNYYTGPGGTGAQLAVGTIITDSQTIYVYNSVPNTVNCTAENSFEVTIDIIDIAPIDDQLVCGGYILPELQVGNYYSGPGGTGQQLNAGDLIDSDQTIYVYAQTTTTPPCSDEESFEVVIKPAPIIDNPGNAGACGPYVLPALTSGGYFTGPGGTGQQLFPGQEITQTTQLYIFAATGGTPNCTSENPFLVVINPEAPDDVAVCGEYELPPLEVGGYFTEPAGQGTELMAGELITTTQDIYVYVDLGTGPNCTDNNFFTVTVTPYPVLAEMDDVFICDNYELPALAVGTYYTAPNGTGNVLQPGSFITVTQPVYVYAFNGECISQEEFLVTIYNTPLVDARSDVLACESYTLDHLIVGNYFTEPNGQGTPLFEGDEITTTQTIYIFSQSNTNPNCVGENSFLVEVFHANADDPEDVDVCDTYTLPVLTEGQYYANPGGPNLANPAANPEIPAGTVLTAPYSATLYVYSQTGGNRINCNDENAFEVNVYETPVVDEPGDIAQCEAYALPALTSGTYRTGQGGTGTVLPAGYLVTSPMTIYVYASVGPNDNPNLCSDEHSFFVDVNIVTVPEYEDQVACGQYILPALAPSQGNYFTAPGGTGTMLSPGDVINTVGINTIYIYKQAGTTIVCDAESSFEVNIIEAPVPMPTDPLVVCGINDFGHGIFNLVPAMEQALGGQPFANVTIHETLADAQFGNQPISENPADLVNVGEYRNIIAYTQTLYIRLESTLTDCYNVGTVQLIVNPRPIATEPEAYELCDNGSNDTDGIAIFDLTTLEDEILGTLNPAQFAVSFYDQDGLIPTPASYPSASQVIIGRVTNTATGCFDEVDVELIVNPLPQATPPTPYTLCDLNNPGDEIEEFDLNTKIDEIIGTQDGIIVTFFKDYNEALAGTGASQILTPESYFNISAVEAIFVRVTVETTGCFRVVLLDVRVEPVPVLVMPTEDELTVCDTNGSGFGVFDLQALIEDMENDAPNLEVTFHYTWQDAVDGNNPITEDLANYQNVDPNIQILYVRVRNTESDCVRQEPYMITLRVEEAPQAPEDLEDLRQCDDQDNNGQNNQAIFDLTVQDAVINAELAPRVVTITYHTTPQSADMGMPRIVGPANYLGTHEQTIWVRVTDPDTECYSVESFQLLLDQPLLLTQPTPLVLCNESLLPNGNDAITEFDLTVKDEEILGQFGIGQGMTVEYYVTDPRLDPATVAIPNPTTYENLGPPLNNPQTLFVKVTTPRGCVSYTTLTIQVLPLPVPDTTPDPLVKCDDNNSPDGMEVFNLSDAAADIRNGDATMVLTYYTSLEDAENRENEIINFTAHNTASATIWVRAEANTGNASHPVCYQIVSFEVIVNMLPELGEAGVIEPYAICEPNTDGVATFDFNTHMDEILGEGVDPADYTVKFFALQANIPNGPAMPYIYTNTTSPNQQNIWVWVRNDDTGCTNIAPLTLLVEEAAIANPITTTFFECDYDGDNDGVFEFDLTVVEPEVLGTQNPATYSVTYYTSLEDAEDGVNAIPNPTAYENELSPDYQMIWVRVTNESTVSGCNEITTLELFVERIPEPQLDADHTTVCIDFVTNDNVRASIIDSGLDATHTFVWYQDGNVMPGETGPTLTVLVAGSYTVIATSATGCVSDPIAPIVIERSGPASPINFGYVVGNPFGDNQVITVLAQGYGEYQYSLDNGPWQNSNVFENVSAYEDHIIHVRDIATADPCDDLELILDLEGVRPIDYPNFFTPNGDGYHDYWQPFGLSNQPAKVYIFDRYGKLMKQISTSMESNGWDGTYNGSPMPADDYWFTIEYTHDGITKEFKGHFALKR